MKDSYIGMTDVPSGGWLTDMLRIYENVQGQLCGRRLHAGVMMSRKTLNGLETRWADAWPKNDEVADIFVEDPFILNTLHYADYDGIDVAACLERAVHYGGMAMDAIQLDMVWPNPDIICAFAERYPDLRIILQAGTRALELADNDAETLIERLKRYGDAIDDILLDRSGGRGVGLDAASLEPFIYEIRARRPDLGITLAGGLGPNTLHLVEPLVRKFPELSIDAQGQLRPSGNSHDPIDQARSEDYLRKAIAMFRGA